MAVDKRKVTLLTRFDFSKASDCIPHKKLLMKMRKYNIYNAAIKWFYSYLVDRHQTVTSTLLTSNHMIYADDSQIYLHCLPSEILNGIQLIQRDAQAVADWATENGLQLNLNKSKVMILGSEAYITSPVLNIHSLPPIRINDTPFNM